MTIRERLAMEEGNTGCRFLKKNRPTFAQKVNYLKVFIYNHFKNFPDENN